jgi:hypothetical protein
MRRRGPALLLVLAAVLLSCHAAADDARDLSRAAFRRGVADAQRGDYAAARDAFVEAYRLFPHPSILLNLGIARWRAGDMALAEGDLARFLSDDGGASAEEIASARAALAAVRARLGTLRLHVAPAPAIARLDGAPLPIAAGRAVDVRVAVGSHVLDVEAAGYRAVSRTVVVAAGQVEALDVTLAPVTSASAEQAPPASDGEPGAWGLVAAAGVAASIGTYAGVRALSFASAYDTAGSGRFQDPAARSAGITLRTTADVAFSIALVAGGIGAYLLLRGHGGNQDEARSALVVRPGFAGLDVTF